MKEWVDYGILGFLMFLSVIVISIGIERIWFYATVRVDDYKDKRELELDLHRRLTLIATIGSNAPYVGLLGTVAGIMLTFIGISGSSVNDTSEIMKGLALALKATAMGLIVAIPSVVFYNMLVRKSEIIATKWEIYHHPVQDEESAPKRIDVHEK
ncbi:TonB-system energizer ExbB [Helicobacter mustelae]|uniref:Putative exbB/tolQ family transport protein n=1 Tax=Helicobacter mustelae (strain ATCC 43772 / CCUG 25715 / CIP 103759 / LMG 18044 / NCTC 12198 / R85-136P) TaxID=679897 RepID=D3UI85_HELM1|nr:TonB-system energizer ExbB [Helicobacter mustelae]CBG40208.1 putative exbB/tolQ family transport protein [Helicobacter mustelae 12198]SQH71708.1 ExbB/TolQ family transport protein [Helicobacter mustelae]STP12834.1 ExbB/TolQ family transport protein [Helicobacter mustelae]